MKTAYKNIVSKGAIVLDPQGKSFDELLERQWLLTNSRGGFASGSAAGCNTRRYHGMLVGTLTPPANRTVSLSNCLETLNFSNKSVELGCFEFDGTIKSSSLTYMTAFQKDTGVHFDYDFGPVQLRKSIYMLPDEDTVAIVYDFDEVFRNFEFSVRPFTVMRDFHSLQKSDAQLQWAWQEYGITIQGASEPQGELFLRSEQMRFEHDAQWWYNFMYRDDAKRGQDCLEDSWSPGTFKCNVEDPCRIILWASLAEPGQSDQAVGIDLETALDSLMLHDRETSGKFKNDINLHRLAAAADQFIVERQINNIPTSTIMAGFPWFLDWGRDTFIALPGLLLYTKRFDEAVSVLTTFAGAVDKGMIPNRFDDYGGQAHYNSIDASLWFVNAAFEYLHISGDISTFSAEMLPAIKWILDSYYSGTRFGIHAADDGLISGGDADTQLTWMDAKCGGIAFTPRYGKAVEINALWYDAICQMAEFYKKRSSDQAQHYIDLSEKVAKSFTENFWNESLGYLNDCVLPDGTIDSSLRPNQIYAVALRNSPLNSGQKKCVTGVVERHLLTAYGLRTLSNNDQRYRGTYEGDAMQRDRAYHNGTVWPHLIGPFIQAYLRTNNFSKTSKKRCLEFLQPLLSHLTDSGCIGSISEIFDGDQPQNPKGCFAQAWAVSETLKAYMLANSINPPDRA